MPGLEKEFTTQLMRSILSEGLPHSIVHFERNEMVYCSGKREETLYFVREGCVKVITYSAEGKSCVHRIESVGSLFGELCLTGPVRCDTAIAKRESVLMRVPLIPLLEKGGPLIGQLLLCLAYRIRSQQRLLDSFVTLDSEHRLAALFLELARTMGGWHDGLLRIDERMSQEELAGMVGTTRSRVGVFLKSFRKNGLIRDDGGSLLVDEQRVSQFGLGYRLDTEEPPSYSVRWVLNAEQARRDGVATVRQMRHCDRVGSGKS